MPVIIREAREGDAAECGRIIYAAFATIAAEHNFPQDFPVNVELSLPIFRLALAVFIPWRGADGFDRRAGWHPR